MIQMKLANKTFYPSTKFLISKMISKVQGDPVSILDPSAGKGDIIEAVNGKMGNYRGWKRVAAIEIDDDLRATLRGKGIRVIDSDFLSFSGPDKFDLIIANPPFDEGDKHLLKAIDIMYRGEIVFLLNAETIRNPYTNTRKVLVKKLSALGADIEYIENAFLSPEAERKTAVEVALVYISVERQVEDDLFAGVDDTANDVQPDIENHFEVSTGRTIPELVAEYNQTVEIGIETITSYYKNYKKIGTFIGLNKEANSYSCDGDLTSKMQAEVNDLAASVRETFWRKALDLDEVRRRLTSSKQEEFEDRLKGNCEMDFTESNIRQFVLNLIGGYEQTLTEAVLEIFKKFTVAHSYSGGLYDENIHYFNGWKTNNAFKVGKKVIIPLHGGYGKGPFIDGYSGKWQLQYGVGSKLRDVDVVMNYFDGMSHYCSIYDAVENAFIAGQSRKILSTYFEITCYKKGTIHLVFRDEDILRRFNVAACRGKEWLPHDYGTKPFSDLSTEEQATAESFEGKESYTDNLNQPVFANGASRLMIDLNHAKEG